MLNKLITIIIYADVFAVLKWGVQYFCYIFRNIWGAMETAVTEKHV